MSSAGVFVVDAKLYKGLIEIRDVGGLFKTDKRLYVGHRDCSELATNMAWQVEAVQLAITAAGIVPSPPVIPSSALLTASGRFSGHRPSFME